MSKPIRIVLVGATTENPSFELNAPLLSRARVLVFRSLDEERVARREADKLAAFERWHVGQGVALGASAACSSSTGGLPSRSGARRPSPARSRAVRGRGRSSRPG